MNISSIANWFGSNRVSAQRAALELGRLDWCGVPFMGGAPELPYIKTRAGLANDLHRHVINLCRVVRDDAACAAMEMRLEGMLLHPDELASAQRVCIEHGKNEVEKNPSPEWAAAYFACSWMGRGGNSGKRREFMQNVSYRWSASGGGSAKRFSSAVQSVRAWRDAFKGTWDFVCMDAIEFVRSAKDKAGHGLYLDPPWPDLGEEYECSFSEDQQRDLAKELRRFRAARVVLRFGVHPLIRELYPASDGWTWIEFETTNQRGGSVPEALIVRGKSYTQVGG